MKYYCRRKLYYSIEPLSVTGYWLGVCHGWFHFHGLTRTGQSAKREFLMNNSCSRRDSNSRLLDYEALYLFHYRPYYLYLLLPIGRGGQFHTSNYDKHDDFNFHITNFPFLSNNIPASPAYGVFSSQLIRYAGACFSYLRTTRLSSMLLEQGYVEERL